MIAQVFDNLFDTEFMVKVEKQLKFLPVSAINIANGTAYPSGESGSHCLMGENIFERKSLNTVVNLMKDSEVFFEMLERIEDYVENDIIMNDILNIVCDRQEKAHAEYHRLEDLELKLRE